MANSGGAGTKFVSVNLNKSYGQPYQRANQSYSGSYGQAASSRGGRPGSGGGGGGGMVVLSRPKSSQKVGTKLSVPPPLNLPSLRKEHQKFDASGPGIGATSVGGSGNGTKTSSGVGWTKPAPAIGLQGKDGDTQVVEGMDRSGYRVDGLNHHESGAYMPPSARSGGIGSSLPVCTKHLPPATEKAGVLWGEDFPSLKAALPVPSVPSHKQDSSNQKQKLDEEYSNQANHSSGSLDMRPHGLAARQSIENRPVENGVGGHDLVCPSRSDHSWKQEDYFTGPLPLVRVNPRSDWADDERDTGHGFVDRSSRDSRMVKSENYWSSDFDMPRTSVLPHKLPNVNQYERWGGQRDDETGIVVSSEVIRGGDTYHRDSRTECRDGNLRKSSPLPRVGNVPEAVNIRNAVSSRVFALNKDTGKESKYFPPQLGETANRDSTFGTKEAIHSSDVHKHWSNDRVSYNSRGIDRSNRFGYQNSNGHKPSFTSPGKSVAVSVPVPNHGREKSVFSRHEKPYIEDFGSAGFDERDILSGGLVGVIKRKKDVVKQTDFHDPVRESFEAELERVQKLQELERQRIIEEQERALEQAQKEEEERQRLVREEEERHRRLEEEAREAAWRAEQVQLEAIRRADEQKAAREEERRRLFLEEERRKQAAKQKLLELEARIAKREADRGKCDPSISTTIPDEKPSVAVKENEASDPDNWDESERMVERLTTSIYPEAPVLSPSAEMGLRPYNSRDSFSDFADAGKPINSWRRDVFETGSGSRFEHDSGHLSPRRDASGRGVRLAPQKEFYGGSSYMSSRTLIMKDAMQEAFVDDFGEPKEEDRWNFSEFHDNFEEKYNDIGWRQGSSRGGNSRFPYPGQSSYHNSETDDHFSYGKSRYSIRQPRVLPPPTLSTLQRHSFRGENEIAVTSEFAGSNKNMEPTESYGDHLERSGTSLVVDLQQNSSSREEKLVKDMGSRCDSQSSLSVTSPPNSPPHLSNDELDESGDSPVVSTAAGGQNVTFSGTKPFMKDVSRKEDVMRTASSSISIAEDEEWTIENNDDLPRQEEYDDEEDGYREGDDELLNEDDYNVDLNQDLEGMHLGDRGSSPNSHNLVLGFNEGVEVAIPSDDFERNLRNDESIFDRDDSYVHNSIPEEQGAINCVQVDDKSYQPAAEGSSQSGSDCENERAVQEAVKGPAIVPHTSNTSNILDGVDAPSGALSSATSQADLPVKLQFGLFSGPTLIPSPVPAIQIGSIQMPLHLHPPVGTSLAHMHPSQPSFFQFGQFRYSPPISQGILPGTALPVSFIQPKLQSNKYNVNQCNGGSRGQSHRDDSKLDSSSVRAAGNNAQTLVINSEVSGHTETKEQDSVNIQSNLESSKGQNVPTVRRVISGGFKSQGSFSGTKGKRFTYAVKNNSARSTSDAFETSFSDFNGFQRRPRRTVQRTEFRVRENADKRQFSGALPVNDIGFDDKATYSGRYGGFFTRSGSKRGSMPNKSMKHTVEGEKSSQGSNGSRNIASMKDHVIKRQSGLSNIREGNLKRNNIYEEDVDAPLQSGVVRVFKQPGIEAPSDEDDFIQVRSKRQMLNDRREQREREIKAKSRALKQPRKPHIARQNNAASTSLNKASVHISLKTHSAFAATEGKGSTNKPEAISCSANLLQPITQICTPAIDAGTESDIRSNKSLKAPPATVVSGSGSDGMSLMFEGNKCEGAVMSMSSKSWCTPCVNQQSQLEEAMKPVKFETQDSCSTSGSHISSSVSEPALPSSSIMMANDKSSFLLTTSPINSLLAGEKIQFGAVTSPTILPVSTRVVSHGIGAPGSKRPSDVQISHNLSATKNDCSLFDKLPNDCSVSLQDCEAEAEAAASAVAVAAITNDEGGENGLGSVTASEAKKIFEGGRQLGSQSRVEEPLSVSLPADLSVENHPISLWPRVSDPQNPSGQMLSHFPGGPPPSHIPIYEMNPVLGGPIFSFGPHEESTVSQTQPQKSTGTGSGPLGAWQQCHSSMDSFYGPPSGFTGPLYSPTGRVPGVQGPPPHMVVYNHFAPFGQFGQVGLSFMGTTYIASSGKQHNPNSTMVGGINEGDVNIISSTQRNASSAPVQQHLAPGSPLIPMASPLAMFDVSPFQPPPPDMQHWSSMHTSALHSAPISQPPQQQQQQQQPEAAPFDQGRHSADQSLNVVSSRFPPDSLASTTAPENCPKKFPAPSSVNNNCNNSNKNNNSPTAQFMDRLGGQSSENAGASTTRDMVGKSDNNNNNRVEQTTATTTNDGFSSHQMPRQHRNPSLHHHQSHSSGGYNGYYHDRGMGNGIPQRNNEWSYRRMGFHGGRNQSFNGGDRGFSSTTRVKQIYVPKQSNSGGGSVTKTEG